MHSRSCGYRRRCSRFRRVPGVMCTCIVMTRRRNRTVETCPDRHRRAILPVILIPYSLSCATTNVSLAGMSCSSSLLPFGIVSYSQNNTKVDHIWRHLTSSPCTMLHSLHQERTHSEALLIQYQCDTVAAPRVRITTRSSALEHG